MRARVTTLQCLQLAKTWRYCDVRNATLWVRLCDTLSYVFECHLYFTGRLEVFDRKARARFRRTLELSNG